MKNESEKDARIRKIISLLTRMGKSAIRPESGHTDYSHWNQTEDEYQQGQEQWLEEVAARKQRQTEKDGG